MFERYTERSRRGVFSARLEAMEYSSPRIEVEHLLLGLMRENAALLARGDASAQQRLAGSLRALAKAKSPGGPKIPEASDMPLTPEGLQALRAAAKEADSLGHRAIRPEHLLLGVLQVGRVPIFGLLPWRKTPVISLLSEFGWSTSQARRQFRDIDTQDASGVQA